MVQFRFDVTEILTRTFGGAYVGKPFPNIDQAQSPDEPTPIIDGLNHNGTNGVYYMTPTAINDYQLPNEPLIAITGAKTIVKTKLAGNKRRGSVKEIINTDDYAITIRGVIINENSKDYPFDEVENIKDVFVINESIPITNAICKILEIENIVISNISWPEMVGQPNMQAYQITCMSDEDFVLIKE